MLLQFDGVYKKARVFINGAEVKAAAYGYIPFFVEADGYLKDGVNTIKVECSVRHPDSRWYSGEGIYRDVYLWTGPKDGIEPESVTVSTVSYAPPVIRVESPAEIRAEIYGACGEGCSFELKLEGAELWSPENPALHTLRVYRGDDSEELSFGIRKLEWNNTGFYINGVNTLLRGGCIHHDNGILGACAYQGAEYRKIKKLKDAGFNAIRSAHNPASKALLEACDELGMLVMDEAWDMWYNHKSRYDYACEWKDNYAFDIEAMVRRDYNHPSVVMYSVGNEVSEPATAEGVEYTRKIAESFRSLDSTRPVACGFNLSIIASSAKGKGVYDSENGGQKNDSSDKFKGMSSTMFNMVTQVVGTGMNKAANSKAADAIVSPAFEHVDICGYNYASGRYPLDAKLHPDRIIVGSETFPQDIGKNWEDVKKYPALIGDFMWTAWDYLGEAGLGAWAYTDDGKSFNKPYPWLLADAGAFDILGNPGAPVAHAAAAWQVDEKPWVGVQPLNHGGRKPSKGVWRGTNAIDSWSWEGCEGQKTAIEVYSSAPSVEVRINGKSLGRRKPKYCKAVYKAKYIPGTLECVSYDSAGRETGRTALVSAGKVHRLSVKTEKYKGLAFAEIYVTDEAGVVECNADTLLRASVSGGRLLGFGSANPRTEESFLSGSYTSYYGKALAIVLPENFGECILTVSGEGIKDASVKL